MRAARSRPTPKGGVTDFRPCRPAPTRLPASEQDFPAVGQVIGWSLVAPRLGATYDVRGNGKTVPVEAMNWSSGSSFTRPTTIPGPRIVRFGCKVDW